MAGDRGSKSAFEALMRKPNNGGTMGGSSNPPRAEGRATEAQAAQTT